MKITSLQVENVKRIKAVRMEPSRNGLTIIGGRNGQGKTSVLDAIAYAFGGETFRPSNLKREDAIGDAYIHIETDEGYVIERKGPKSDLRVTDPSGLRGGQKILDDLVGKYAINLPRFMHASDVEKAKMLLQILGVGDELAKLEKDEKSKYNERLALGRIMEQKVQAAKDMPEYFDVPETAVSVSELIQRQQAILAQNGRNEEMRKRKATLEHEVREYAEQIAMLQAKLDESRTRLKTANKTVAELHDESTAELEQQIQDFEEINRKIRANDDKKSKTAEAEDLKSAYGDLTNDIEKIRARRIELLNGCTLPYPGLSVSDGKLLLDGRAWDCMSGAQQLVVGCAISLALNPKCRMVLVDKMEQFDQETLSDFDEWLKEHNIQAITTRVSTGEECSLIIEDGEVAEAATTSTTELTEEDY